MTTIEKILKAEAAAKSVIEYRKRSLKINMIANKKLREYREAAKQLTYDQFLHSRICLDVNVQYRDL